MIGWLYLVMTFVVYYPYYALDEFTWFGTFPMFPFHQQWITPESYFYLLAGYMARVFFILTMAHLFDYLLHELTNDERQLKRFGRWLNGFLTVCIFEIVATVNYICRFGESFWLKGFDTLTIRGFVVFIVAATIVTLEQRLKYDNR